MFYFERNALHFGKGEDNLGDDFAILASTPTIEKNYDLLIFTDSKGLSLHREQHAETWAYKLGIDACSDGKSVLIVARPKEITIFFTLVNFLDLNHIKFKVLITNLGFVDFTPKKFEFIKDIQSQIPAGISEKTISVNPMGEYLLSSGQYDKLYSLDYGSNDAVLGNKLAENFEITLLSSVLEFDSSIKIERIRPAAFYSQLKASNEWIRLVSNHSRQINFVLHEIGDHNPESISYDGVHFTKLGHLMFYEHVLQISFHLGILSNRPKNSSNRKLLS